MLIARMSFLMAERAMLLASAAGAVFAVAALAAEPAEKLEDVQIGEKGALMRVALICHDRCEIEPGDGVEFRLVGVNAALDVDLEERSRLAERLTITPAEGESIVRVKLAGAARLNEARIVDCASDSGPAPCIEYRFDTAPVEGAGAAPAAQKTAPPRMRENGGEAEARAVDMKNVEEPPFIGAVILAPGPTLRDEPAKGVIYLPDFAPPERLSPKIGAPQTESGSGGGAGDEQASIVPDNVDVGRPSLITVDRAEALARGGAFDIRKEAEEILGKSFDVGACEGAKARLQGDAWALDAMIDLAYCKAASGKPEEADADFKRLLAYTPDNYEALLGRGLIALAAGERKAGLEYCQDALNALPPIAESDRIAEAMQRY